MLARLQLVDQFSLDLPVLSLVVTTASLLVDYAFLPAHLLFAMLVFAADSVSTCCLTSLEDF